MGSVRKSVFYSLAQNYLLMVLQLATTMVLARILRPDEVGIFSVAASLAALASVVRDFGVAEYLIQEANLTRDKIRAALAINIMVSWTMAALMFGGSFVAGEFYSQAGIGSVMRVLACNFLLIPFGAVTMAYFRRQMNFAPNFRITMVAGVASSIAAVALGMSGFSYMSMAYSSLLGVAITVAMTLAMRPPELPRASPFVPVRAAATSDAMVGWTYAQHCREPPRFAEACPPHSRGLAAVESSPGACRSDVRQRRTVELVRPDVRPVG